MSQHVYTTGHSRPTLCRAQGPGNTILSLQAQHCTTLSGPGSDLPPDWEPAEGGPGPTQPAQHRARHRQRFIKHRSEWMNG